MMERLGFRPYQEYKDTAADWIERIPRNWNTMRAKFLLVESNIRSVFGNENLLSLSKYRGVIRKDQMSERGGQAESLVGYKKVEPGDLVINKMQASNGLMDVSEISGITSPDYAVYRAKENGAASIRFIRHILCQPEYQAEIKRRAKGVMEGFIRLYTDDLFDLPIILPSLGEQKSILAFLDDKCAKIDAAVKIKEDEIALLRERRQIIIQDAVTRGLNPAAPMKDSGIDWIGLIPVHWELKPMRAFFRFRNEKNDPIKTENILSLSIAHGVTPYSEEGRGGNKRKDDLTAYKLAYPGDIVLNSMNVIVGAVGRSEYFGAISPVYYAFYPVGDHIHVPFYEQIFLNAGFQRGLLRLGKGILIKLSGTGQLNTIRMKISTNDLKSLLFPTPPPDEQQAIVSHITEQNLKIDNGIATKQRQVAALKEYKTSLINAAVTGKIKVT
jgi:type I restriction enzyme S subunit